jgi:DNA-binding GntR family transcriptional regulator
METDQGAPTRRLADQIAAAVRSGEYPPGARLRQEILADRFNVSRTPIREALRILEAKGVVELIPNRGAVVRMPAPREIREAYQVRAELEGLAAELAAEWITEDQIERLSTAEARFRRAVEALLPAGTDGARATAKAPTRGARTRQPTWVETNEEFHDLIVEAAGNRRLRSMLADLHEGFLRPVMLATTSMDGRWMRENVAQHEAIVAAIVRHDAAEARRQMTHHVKRSGELMVRWLEEKAGSGVG